MIERIEPYPLSILVFSFFCDADIFASPSLLTRFSVGSLRLTCKLRKADRERMSHTEHPRLSNRPSLLLFLHTKKREPGQ